jgi:hypothetical protein
MGDGSENLKNILSISILYLNIQTFDAYNFLHPLSNYKVTYAHKVISWTDRHT